MVLADQGLQGFRKADKADGERAVLEHLAHFVVPVQLVGIDPYALTHEEGIVAHALFALDLESLGQLIYGQIHHAGKLTKEHVEVLVGFDGKAREVDGSKGQVSAAVGNLARGIKRVSDYAGSAAHVGNLGLGMAGLIVL